MSDNCPLPPKLTLTGADSAAFNAAVIELQLRFNLTDTEMVLALLGWTRRTLTFKAIQDQQKAALGGRKLEAG